MVAELRRSGTRMVLFTDEAPIYRHLNELSITKYKIPYLKNGKVVGIDLYFDRKLWRTVRRVKDGQMVLDI